MANLALPAPPELAADGLLRVAELPQAPNSWKIEIEQAFVLARRSGIHVFPSDFHTRMPGGLFFYPLKVFRKLALENIGKKRLP